MITKLTPSQEKDMVNVRDNWLKIGRSCEPLNRPAATESIRKMYEAIGEKRPTVLFFSSPLMCILAYGVLRSRTPLKFESLGDQLRDQLRDQLGDQLWDQLRDQLRGQLWDQLGGQLWDQLRDQLWDQLWDQLRDQLWDQLWDQLGGQLRGQLWDQLGGQLGGQLWDQLGGQLRDQLGGQLRDQLRNYFSGAHECAWEVFYHFGERIGAKYPPKLSRKLGLWIEQSKQCYWWFPYKGIALASERPSQQHLDERGRLHSFSEKAIRFSDDWGFYFSHGVAMEEWMITTHPSKLDAKKVLSVPNVDQRRELIRRIGIEQLVDHLPHKVLDKQDEYELLAIDLSPELKRCRYLKMKNPSIGLWHLEGVSNDCQTVQHALNWRRYKEINRAWKPCQLT
jgi:hypothetical protein